MPPLPYYVAQPEGREQADEWMRLGAEAQMSGRLPEAQEKYMRALRLDPRHSLALQNLAIVFAQSNLLNEALLTIERAAMCDGKHSAIQMNRALLAFEAERIDECLDAARKAVALAPDNPMALMSLTMALTTAGQAKESLEVYNKVLDLDPKNDVAAVNACFVQTLTDMGPEALLHQRRRWWEMAHHAGKVEPHKNVKTMDRVLRVGYVGGDFKSHSAAFIFNGVLLHHTKDIEMYLYCSLPVDPEKDLITKKLQDACPGRWRDISKMSDEDADKLIREDRIDILVDLAAHTSGGRLTLFTRKPAPVQVTAWGFAHGTGCPEIDYFFADPTSIPQEERKHYAEKIWDLPSIVTMEPPTHYNLKGVSKAPALKNDFVTFGCFARYEKLGDECIKTYGEILRQVPESKIEFKDNCFRRPFAIKRIYELMPDIAPERLLFSVASSHPDHMQAYQGCDVFLNPFPHSSGVVTLECLWMGVPMITLYGTQAAGRTAASVLSAMGRQAWIAKTPDEYVNIAVQMAADVKPLNEVRKTLRDELLNSPVVAGYVGKVEEAYKAMWKAWCDK